MLSPLHEGCRLPTRRVPPPYTEGTISLHGGFDFPTRENGICGSAGRLAPPCIPAVDADREVVTVPTRALSRA